jgi:hypothetical protein
MKTIRFFAVLMLLCISGASFAQDVDKRLDEARSAYGAGNLEAARFALQQAMNEIDIAIGNEVLSVLPSRMGEMAAVTDEDQVSSVGMGYAGLFVSRTYRRGEAASARLQVIADSPLLAGINTILALPFIAGDSNQKRIRVGGYRALLQRNEGSDGEVSWDVQIPFGSSLMSLEFKGIPEENAVTAMANTIPIEQVAKLVQ